MAARQWATWARMAAGSTLPGEVGGGRWVAATAGVMDYGLLGACESVRYGSVRGTRRTPTPALPWSTGRGGKAGAGAGFDDGADEVDEGVPDGAGRFPGDVAGGGGGVGGVEAERDGGHDGGVNVVHHKDHL